MRGLVRVEEQEECAHLVVVAHPVEDSAILQGLQGQSPPHRQAPTERVDGSTNGCGVVEDAGCDQAVPRAHRPRTGEEAKIGRAHV